MKTSLLSLATATIALAQSPGTFTATGNMITPRYRHTATLLLNGKVLIAGGLGAHVLGPMLAAEIYDPATGTFSSTGDMTMALSGATAALLPNGQVLIVGMDYYFYPDQRLEAQAYDPLTGTFSPAGSIENGKVTCAVATSLTNGKVLVSVGTWWPPAGVQGVPPYLYDPTSATFAATGQYVTTANLDEDLCPTEALWQTGRY
ncbi:MAG TPA: kelch repeat-containing protein [Bryobacteraceae bacterium]|nr:kelch repeat-containing protein [Bryobacteraceae bacterium]